MLLQLVRAQPKGWMDEEGVKFWLENVWNRRPGALLRKRSLLVWDMFRAHLLDDVKEAARKIRTDLSVIPGGLTSQLQPLDVAVNKPFKDRLRQKWNEWFCSDAVKTTKGGALQKPELPVVLRWVREAWDELPPAIIQRGFLKCCISNALDGSEDDAVYNGDSDESDGGESDRDDPHDDAITAEDEKEMNELFDSSDEGENDFDGF